MLVRFALLTHIQDWHFSCPFFLLLTLLLVRRISGNMGIVLLTFMLSFWEKPLQMTLLFHAYRVLHMYIYVLWVGQPRSGYLRNRYLFHTPHQWALPSYATCGRFSAKGKVYIHEDKIRRFQKHMVKFSDVSSQKSYLPSLGSQASNFHIIHNYHSYNFRPAYPTYLPLVEKHWLMST